MTELEDIILGIIEKLCYVDEEVLHFIFELTENVIKNKEMGVLDEKRVD